MTPILRAAIGPALTRAISYGALFGGVSYAWDRLGATRLYSAKSIGIATGTGAAATALFSKSPRLITAGAALSHMWLEVRIQNARRELAERTDPVRRQSWE